jgi:hypothetical protein
MTREEILNKEIEWSVDDVFYYGPLTNDEALQAMEIYAKQERLSILKYAQYQSTRNPEQLEKMYLESKEK